MAGSYAELCKILMEDFGIPKEMLPPAKYFKPTQEEQANEESHIYRTAPDGAGEPEWGTRARQALIWAMEEAGWSIGEGGVSVNGKHFYALDELERELEAIAEKAGVRSGSRGRRTNPIMMCL